MLILANNRAEAVAQINAQLRKLKLRLGLDAFLWVALVAALVWYSFPVLGALAGATGALYLKWAWGRYKRVRGNMMAGLQFLDLVHNVVAPALDAAAREAGDAPVQDDAAPGAPDAVARPDDDRDPPGAS